MEHRFSVADQLQEGLNYLDRNGYVVFGGALNTEQVEHAKNLLWDHIENEIDTDICDDDIRRDDPSSWTGAWPGSASTGIISSNGIGQSQFLWFVRGNENVRRAFAGIWGTDSLLTSFDGGNVFRDWSKEPLYKTENGWYHVDQNAAKCPDKEAVQGLVSLYDATAVTGGLTVLPRSHLQFAEFSERHNVTKARPDYIQLRHSDPVFQIPKKLVTCFAGDLCLWDSRTVHCNTPGGTFPVEDGAVPGKAQPGELLRACAYVCMTPRSKANEHTLQLRKKIFRKGVTTSHWPHRNVDNAVWEWEMRRPFQHTPEQLALV
eukprot:TRINITY_DN67774_c11_g5_i1.p1 TRINITY_DN67774_c11_g5~~TRINITY_DN67774_c11_g5_i1.p1  ORF type:complete len:318 (+),score=13.53 TRINITY_DN67774_c11_g5_i1:52-1005(+)